MRALFTVQPSVGHLHPLVPVARALSEAGDEVAICSAPSFRPEVEAFGLAHVDAGLDWLMSDHATWDVFPPMPPPGPEFPAWAVLTLADITTGREALSSGVPMLVVPISADQPYSAERSADLGVARTLGPDDRAQDAIREAVRQVLAEPTYRANARDFQAKTMALPGPDEMVGMIELLRG
jgi:UDP:flavonoid glycosyltransferase YjiC (YdhE family)